VVGWNETLQFMKSHVVSMPVYNVLKKQKTVEYYQKAERKAAIKRMKRIVSQNLKKASGENEASSSHSKTMASVIKNSKMRYAKKSTPEERRQSKFDLAANVESTSSEEDENPSIERADYAESELAGPSRYDDDAQTLKKQGSKRKKRGQKYAKEANEAHTKMCNKAMGMMDKINRVLDKYDDTDSD